MTSTAFRILAVSPDRSLLRGLSRFLSVFGYNVQQASNQQQAVNALANATHQFVLVDGTGNIDPHLVIRAAADTNDAAPHVMQFVDATTTGELADSLEAGAGDFLRKPIVFGELLSRIRDGARILEYERRLQRQSVFDPITGLLSRTGFHDRVRFELDYPSRHRLQLGFALFDMDFLAHINAANGWPTGNEAIKSVSQLLVNHTPEGATVASFGAGRFAVMLPGFTGTQLEQWANEFAETVRTLDFTANGEQSIPLTVSGAVKTLGKNTADIPTAEELVDQLKTTLEQAKSSGRDYIASDGEFNKEEQAWANLATAGDVFRTTTAVDVISPATIILSLSTTRGEAGKLFAQTQIPEIPVVDQKGKYFGILFHDEFIEDCASSKELEASIESLAQTEVPVFDEQTPFDELMNFFSDSDHHLVVILRGRTPIGTVRRESLASLSESVRSQSLRPRGEFSTSTDYLVIASS